MRGVPIVRAKGEGEQRWFSGGGVHVWKASAGETGGALIALEDSLEQGKVTPLHQHPEQDELVYVLEGELRVSIAGQEYLVGSGGTLFSPRGVPHAFEVVSPSARLLMVQTPGSGEAFYREASEPLGGGANPGRVDFGRIRTAAVSTGSTVIVGPPPFRREQ
jgi:quercetin dioxygenase-like cupin family protein